MPGTQKVGAQTVPNTNQYVSHQGDTLDYVAKRYNVSVASLRAANKDLDALAKEGDTDELPFGIVLALPLAKDRFADPANPAKVSGVGASSKEPGADPTADLPVYRRTNPWSPDANWTQTSNNFGSQGDKDSSKSGSSSGGGSVGGSFNVSATALKGNSNAQKAFNYFVGKGLSKEQAAGIVGNLMQESGCNPGSVQQGGPGRGIAQWSQGERWQGVLAQASKEGKDPHDLGVQLDYLWKEMNTTEKGSLSAVKGASSAADAAVAFEKSFERAGTPNNSARMAYARSALSSFA